MTDTPVNVAHENVVGMHGSAVSIDGLAVLLTGPSGSGKSDLVLRCLAMPSLPGTFARFEFVADDHVMVTRDGCNLFVSAPATIVGKLEVRGLGIVEMPTMSSARLSLLAALVGNDTAIDRFPERFEMRVILGVAVPLILVRPFEASAPAKLALALRHEKHIHPT